jgi:hypothetical protein
MTGFNMLPGCNVRDIPGNRPKDLAEEAFVEKKLPPPHCLILLKGNMFSESGSPPRPP